MWLSCTLANITFDYTTIDSLRQMVASIILAVAGLFFVGFGFLIWYFKIAGVIAGYDATKVTNPDALAKWVGKCMMITGALAWSISLIRLLFESDRADLFAFSAFMVGSTLSIVVTLAGTQRYNK
ncbi:DUF3784 domain-containing protein [uncultured Spirosoma sp.]|uniref:DUF3784 domain-containing protein n=1 Tax=uncultured Spirosoma sp. TaxID=278208 RepID=UPI00258C33CB|nr:DUF3784 domain-containing protein [uncultured Spirosoma sp.]